MRSTWNPGAWSVPTLRKRRAPRVAIPAPKDGAIEIIAGKKQLGVWYGKWHISSGTFFALYRVKGAASSTLTVAPLTKLKYGIREIEENGGGRIS